MPNPTFIPDTTKPSDRLVYDLINHDNNESFSSETLFLGAPAVNDYLLNPRDTKMYARARLSSGSYGDLYLYYDRIKLDGYLRNVLPVTVNMNQYNTTWDLISYFNNTFKMGLEQRDVVYEVLDKIPNASNAFRIQDTSYAWQGSVPLVLIGEKVNIAEVVSDGGVLDVIRAYDTPGQINGEVYGFYLDAEMIGDVLFNLKTGDPVATSIITALNNISYDIWVNINQPAKFNLRGATAGFNGLVIDSTYPGKGSYNYVIEILLDKELCPDFFGPLVLYYVR